MRHRTICSVMYSHRTCSFEFLLYIVLYLSFSFNFFVFQRCVYIEYCVSTWPMLSPSFAFLAMDSLFCALSLIYLVSIKGHVTTQLDEKVVFPNTDILLAKGFVLYIHL